MATAYPSSQNDLEKRAREAAATVADKASELAGKAGQRIDSALDAANDTARTVAKEGREAGERMQEVAGNLKSAVDKSLREQPMTTLAVATIAGFVLGALWKS